MKPFDLEEAKQGAKVLTRNGLCVQSLGIDGDKLTGRITTLYGCQEIYFWDMDGKAKDHKFDLMMI